MNAKEQPLNLGYDSIDFGLARAELESTARPRLIIDGFFNYKGVMKSITNDTVYLVLGNKGSGKSAIAEKIKLESTPASGMITTVIHLSDFPFKNFGKIVSGNEEPEAKYPTTWLWLLLLITIDSFSRDNASNTQNDVVFSRAVESLTNYGFLPPTNLSDVVYRSTKGSFKTGIPKILELAFEDSRLPIGPELQFRRLVDHLKALAFTFRSPNKHIIIVDGLDDILLTKGIQYKSLSALVFETDRLNLSLWEAGVNIKILLLCRSDLYERLPGPNKNKIRQDSAIELDWYHDPRIPEGSMLVELANLRAKLSLGSEIDIFEQYAYLVNSQLDSSGEPSPSRL